MNTMTVTAVSARIRYNNYADENRTYDIAADVDVSNGTMGAVSNGSLVAKGSGMGQGVSFDSSMGYKGWSTTTRPLTKSSHIRQSTTSSQASTL